VAAGGGVVMLGLNDVAFLAAVAQGKTLWTPAAIPTALWLDAADPATVTTISGAVSQWNDKSGNSNHFSQATSTRRPTINDTGVNGKPALVFDGINDSLVANSAVIKTTHSLFIVFTPTIENVSGILIGQWVANQAGRLLFTVNQNCVGNTSPGRLNLFNSTVTQGACASAAGLAVDTSIANTPTIIESICTTGSENWKLLKDGTEYESATITAVFQGVNTALGTTSAIGDTVHYDGLIAEVIIIESVVSAIIRQMIEGYLAYKWLLTAVLPADHPYKNTPPMI